ncbi:TRAP transporter permease [Chloroflexota bacterium]
MEESEVKNKLTLKKTGSLAITLLCAAMALLYFYTAKEGQLPLFQQRGILLAGGFLVIFLTIPMFKGRRPWWTICIDLALSAVTMLATINLIIIDEQSSAFGFHPTTGYDIVLSVGLVIAVLEATRRTIGPVLPIVGVLSILYALFGHNLPGIFKHVYVDFSFVMYYLGVTTDGIWGMPIYVVSTVVVLFLIFAALLRQCGLLRFFIDLSNGMVGRYRGGPAKIAVLASSVMATMSGSGVANVVATGSFTIPLMKRSGYSADFAGAVEADASTGGVVTPPVMGAAAFIIAEYLDIPYWSIVVAALLPAFLYYLGLYVGVDLEAMKKGLKGLPEEEVPSARKVFLRNGYMVLPIFVLIYFLGVVKSSAMLAAFWSILSIIGLGMIRKETRQGLLGWGLIEGFANGIKDCLLVVATVACAGIVVGVLTVTGLGFRLSYIMVVLSGGNLFAMLLFCAIISIILGMGMTTSSVYLLMAMVVAPAIVKLGVLPLAAHLFVFFFGNLSHITPPVCVSVFAAIGISGGKPFPTAWQSMKLGAILFIVPFFFVFDTSLIMQGNPSDIVISAVTAMIGVTALASALSNYTWLGTINVVQRVMLGVGGLALAYPSVITSIIGGALVLPAILYAIARRAKQRESLVGLK